MRNKLIPFMTIVIIAMVGCKKDDPIKEFDCLNSTIYYSETHQEIQREIHYYRNGLIVRYDYSPIQVCNYEYDKRNNLVKYGCGNGGYTLNSYDERNRHIRSVQFVKNTIFAETHNFYSDTRLTTSVNLNQKGDTTSINKYYYNSSNKLDSVISTHSRIYHTYLPNSHKITRFDLNNNKVYESNKEFQDELILKSEEYYYNPNGILSASFVQSKEYDAHKNLLKQVIVQTSNTQETHYMEFRYFYDTTSRLERKETYNEHNQLLNYEEHIYDRGKPVKVQSYDAVGNKTGYRIIDNTCLR